MNIIDTLAKEQIDSLNVQREDFSPGCTVVVQIKIVDFSIDPKTKKEVRVERVQSFEGVCIAKRNKGINSSFTVRKMSSGCGVEKTFPYYSPFVINVKVLKRGRVRRAKLYYLRALTGKAARIKQIDTVKKKA